MGRNGETAKRLCVSGECVDRGAKRRSGEESKKSRHPWNYAEGFTQGIFLIDYLYLYGFCPMTARGLAFCKISMTSLRL